MKNKGLKKVVGLVADNFGLKLLAVVVSCGLWFVVNSITDPIETKPFTNVPVEIINEHLVTDEDKVYEVLDGTDMVNVTIIGKRSVVTNISKDDIRVVADMSKLTFMNTVDIEVSSIRSNSSLEFRTNVDNLKLSIEDIKRDQKKINISTTGEPAEGFVVGDINTSQNVVRLSGPESLISQIDHAEAVANIDGYSSDVDTNVEIRLYDANDKEVKSNSIKMNISTVNVSVSILATKEVPLSFTITGEPADGYIVGEEVLSVPETVLIAGRRSVLDSVTKIAVADPALSVADKSESMTNIINIKKYLPTGVRFADSSFSGNVSVTVGIEELITRELSIPAKNFAAGNRPAGFDLVLREVTDRDQYTIKISGTRSAVSAVDPDSVIGVIDMNAVREGLGLQEWSAGRYAGEIVFELPEDVTLAEKYMMTVELETIGEDEEQ